MRRKFSHLKKHHQLFFSLVILSGIVCLWRGMWGLLDLYLLAHDPTLSFSVSVLVGVLILGVTHYTIDKII